MPGVHGTRYVARQCRPSIDCPDTETLRKIFKLEYFIYEKECLVENSDLISGDLDTRSGCTSKPAVCRFSDTYVSPEKQECVVNEKGFLAESSNDVSGKHETRNCHTTWLFPDRFC